MEAIMAIDKVKAYLSGIARNKAKEYTRKIRKEVPIEGDVVIVSSENLEQQVRYVLEGNEPVVCVVKISVDQSIEPRQASYKKADGQMASRPLEDMRPLLSPEIINEIMTSVTKD